LERHHEEGKGPILRLVWYWEHVELQQVELALRHLEFEMELFVTMVPLFGLLSQQCVV